MCASGGRYEAMELTTEQGYLAVEAITGARRPGEIIDAVLGCLAAHACGPLGHGPTLAICRTPHRALGGRRGHRPRQPRVAMSFPPSPPPRRLLRDPRSSRYRRG